MLHIDKYLESQQALALKKSISNKTISNISEKSIKSADRISKKQNKYTHGKVTSKEQPSKAGCKFTKINEAEYSSTAGPSTYRQDPESGSEYAPSSEDEEQITADTTIPVHTKHAKLELKKVIDDGDKRSYHVRTEKWKNTLKLIRTEGCVLDEADIQTADVRYLMDGHDDGDEEHEVNGGLRVPNYIWKQLYKYQRSGIKWLWELHQLKSGGLLGDEMGLGKTVQLIAFLAGLSKTSVGTWGGLGPSVIVTPATVIYQWVSHFHYWYPGLRVAVLHNSGSHSGRHHSLIREIHDAHGVLLLTYAGVVRYCNDIMNRKWHYVILDEGHKIRNPDTQVSKMVKKFTTPHKILITGSPMQNSLQELWSLFDFMSPGLLGTQAAFMEYFAVPITQGGYSNATQFQEVAAFEIAKSLKDMITPYMIRRTKAEVQEHIRLPEKSEQVLFCSLSQEQRDLYLGYLLSQTVRSILDKEQRFGDPLRARILVAISTLRKICNHPDIYLYEAVDEDEPVIEDKFGHWKRSGKMTVVQSLLKIWQKQGHRALIFSQSRAMLCILEQFLVKHNYKYLKMDGTVSVGHRQNIIKSFNENSEYLVFLATTRVGGLGVNLTGADRVIIYDPDWNPATDSQAKERAWRIGQRKNVTIYRLLSAGTIEEKIYQRQVFKHLLGNKVLIDPNQKNPLKTSHLQGLFTLEEPNRDGDTETASIFSHTKVGVSQRDEDTSKIVHCNDSVSYSMKKIVAMRKMAQKISRKIASENVLPTVDPRERYKTQREQLLEPPKIFEPEINTIDDQITDVSFEAALSEMDIIKLHSKKDYLEKLLSHTIPRSGGDNEDDEVENKEHITEQNENVTEQHHNVVKNESKNQESCILNVEDMAAMDSVGVFSKTQNSVVISEASQSEENKRIKKFKQSSKRKNLDEPSHEIEGLIAVKKVKRKNEQKEKKFDDEYVLSKLFAKSGLQSALEHDQIVGLAEKEDRHRLKEEASRKAKEAVKALRKSVKKNRRN